MSKKNPATGGGFPVTHFLAKKEENPNQKNETTTRNKTQTASKRKTNNDFIRTCQKVEKWKKRFLFLENSGR